MKRKPDHWEATRHSLLARLKDHSDDQSWQEFFHIYARLIYSVAVQSGLSHAESEEVVQETVLSVSRKINQFKAVRSAGSFKAWLSRLIQWRIKDQVRRRRPEEKARFHVARDPSGEAGETTATEERVPDPAVGGFDQIWEQEWQEQIKATARARLRASTANPVHYQIFQMHVLQERPVGEVARAFGVTENQIYIVKHRLGKAFEELLKAAQSEFR